MGLRITRRSSKTAVEQYDKGLTALEVSLLALLSVKETISILQVGANDGKWGDPLWRLVQDNLNRTSLILVEPQPEIARHLRENYRAHPSCLVLEVAVSVGDKELELFRVRPELWEEIQGYGRQAPKL